MGLYILLAIVVLVGGLLAISASKPNTFRLERGTLIAAPPARVEGFLTDFHQWALWSPWEKMDTDLKRTYEGAPSGVGAVYTWDGKKTGTGRMEIRAVDPAARVLVQLDFLKPMPANNMAEFTLTPEAGGTRIVWAMYGPQKFMNKVMSNFFNMEKFVGPQFEEGLANLKAQAES